MTVWRRLTFSVPESLSDDLIVCLHERGSLGVESAGGLLHAWFGAPLDEPALVASLRADLGDEGGRIALTASEEVPDGFWHERWQAGLRPMALGERFLIVAGPATPPEAPGRLVIRLTPGRAFGTGEHATTRMCLELMESRVTPGHGVLDVGTGSGILAIAARLLGADPVVAIDIDPVAVEVAARNAELNSAGGIRFVTGGAGVVRRGFDLVLANLTGVTLVRVMEDLARLASRRMILSGILREEEEELILSATSRGFTATDRKEGGDWVALALERSLA